MNDNMLSVTVYCDDSGLYSEEEYELDNLTELDFPEEIVKAWYTEHENEFREETSFDLGLPEKECTFEHWYEKVYTAEDTIGLCDFARERDFWPKRHFDEDREANEGFYILSKEVYGHYADGTETLIALAYRGGGFPQWVTWEGSLRPGQKKPDYYWGHYTPHEREARADYHERLMKHYERSI